MRLITNILTFVFSLLYGTPAPSVERQHPEAWPARFERVPVNKELLTGTVPVNKKLLAGTVLDSNLFLYIILESSYQSHLSVKYKKSTNFRQHFFCWCTTCLRAIHYSFCLVRSFSGILNKYVLLATCIHWDG